MAYYRENGKNLWELLWLTPTSPASTGVHKLDYLLELSLHQASKHFIFFKLKHSLLLSLSWAQILHELQPYHWKCCDRFLCFKSSDVCFVKRQVPFLHIFTMWVYLKKKFLSSQKTQFSGALKPLSLTHSLLSTEGAPPLVKSQRWAE